MTGNKPQTFIIQVVHCMLYSNDVTIILMVDMRKQQITIEVNTGETFRETWDMNVF